jgi:exosortase D (VPLPA-CTERM-specific)
MKNKQVWSITWQNWLWIFVAIALTGINFADGLSELITRWDKQEEYSHGYLLPFLTVYFIWQQRNELRQSEFSPSWLGFWLIIIAIIISLIGEISALFILVHYAFIVILLGIALTVMGQTAVKPLLIPLALLIFAIPLPYFLEASLSAQLQLLSSQLGVNFIRWCQIPVYLEGNVIDLGNYKLQVIEACSGLRYLFPLMSIGFICAYLFHTSIWKRVFIFITTIPITLLMNSFRIGITGLLVNQWGTKIAEGFLHDFEGWVIFMICFALLIVEMSILTKIGSKQSSFRELFGLNEVIAISENTPIKFRPTSYPLIASIAVLLIASIILFSVDKREEIIPERQSFSRFPLQLGQWHGVAHSIDPPVIKALGFSDYILADYTQAMMPMINFYVAYYNSQRKGNSPHSPRVCIPGGGWQISAISRLKVHNNFKVNRIIISKGNSRQLVYYWFQERGRIIADEYTMKWYLFYDALFLNRTDGALVRLTTPLISTEPIWIADQRLQLFSEKLLPVLTPFIPQ